MSTEVIINAENGEEGGHFTKANKIQQDNIYNSHNVQNNEFSEIDSDIGSKLILPDGTKAALNEEVSEHSPAKNIVAIENISIQRPSTDNLKQDKFDMASPQKEENIYSENSFASLDEDNISQPFLGYTDEDHESIFPIVNDQAEILYREILALEKEREAAGIASILLHGEPIAIPQNMYFLEGGGIIKLRIIKERLEQMNNSKDETDSDNCDSDTNANDQDVLLLPLNNGWKREIVMRSICSSQVKRKNGNVYYQPPQNGKKMRSMKEIEEYLLKTNEFGLTTCNFSFVTTKVSQDHPNEFVRTAFRNTLEMPKPKIGRVKSDKTDKFIIKKPEIKITEEMIPKHQRSIKLPSRYADGKSALCPERESDSSKDSKQTKHHKLNDGEMVMGMLPPKYPRRSELYSGALSQQYLSPDTPKRKRGRPLTPGSKKYLTLEEALKTTTEECIDDNAMFQISAFNQSQSFLENSYGEYQGMQYEDMYPMLENTEEQLPSTPDINSISGQQSINQLLPCSIGCADMDGQLPNLQCNRCFCLYHPECLGLPLNLKMTTFMCSNCEGETCEEDIFPPALPTLIVKPQESKLKKVPTGKTGGNIPTPQFIASHTKFLQDLNAMKYFPQPPRQNSMKSPLPLCLNKKEQQHYSKLISMGLTVTRKSIPKAVAPLNPIPVKHVGKPKGYFPRKRPYMKCNRLITLKNTDAFIKALGNFKSFSLPVLPKLPNLEKGKPHTEVRKNIPQQEINLHGKTSRQPEMFLKYPQGVAVIGDHKLITVSRISERNETPLLKSNSNEITGEETGLPVQI